MNADIRVPATPEERLARAEQRLEAYRLWFRRLAAAAAAFLVLCVLVLGAFGAWSTRQIDRLQESVTRLENGDIRDRCDNRLTGDYLVAIARAFAALPESIARGVAAGDIARAAQRIADAETVCAHGVPAPLEPTPPTT